MRTSKSFGAFGPLHPHLVTGPGGLAAEVADVRKDVDGGFQNAEGRVGFPILDALDPGTLLAAGQASFVMVGRNLLQGQTFDTLTIGVGAASVALTLLKPGDSGFRVRVTQGLAGLVVTFTGGLLNVELAAAGSTAAQVTAAINNVANPTYGIFFAVSGGGGTVLVMAETQMTGGAGYYNGNTVEINGQSCKPVHAAGQWTNTSITVLVPALTGRVATDIVGVYVQSNGISALPLSAVLT
jgi:hypothetical protein